MAPFSLRDRANTAMVAYCEASSGTKFERECVIHSVFNRVYAKGKWFSRPTPCGVVFLRMQYSETNDDSVDNANLERGANASDDDPIMAECYELFDRVVSGVFDPTNGATHYHDKSIAPPAWADPARGAVMTLETPKFKFYANVK